MDRYGKYFINNFLWISDHYCQYYIQDPYWCPEEILDVQFVSFMMWQDAEQWLWQCVEHDPHTTMERLRSFLTFNTSCQVHRFDDRRVVREVAKEMALWMHKIVIEPKMGQALILDAYTGEPSVPIETEPAPDVSNLLTDLRQQLNAIVAGQKKKYNALEAKLAKMSDEEVAAAYGKRVGKGLILNAWDGLVDLVKSVPDIFDSTLKAVWGLYKTQARLAAAAVQSIRTGSSDPLNREFQTAIQPLVDTYDQAKEVVSMLQVLLGDEEVYDMLYGFAGKYYNNTHPLEKTEMASEAFSETVITIILGLFTGGVGAGANILAKTGRLQKVGKLLKNIYNVIKRTPSRVKLPKKETIKNMVSNVKKRVTKKNKGPKVEPPNKKALPEPGKKTEKLDNKEKKDYFKDYKNSGPKTTPEPKKPNKAKNKSTTEPSRTKPSGKKVGKPRGERAPESGSQKRKHKRENESADTLADAGYDVDQGPHTKPNGKNPDYKIEDEYFDCLAPDTDNVDQVRKGISRKVKSGQTERIILNMDDTNLKPSDISEVLQRKPKQGLKEVVGIKKGKITQIFP